MVRLGTQPHCVGVADVAHAGPLPVLSHGDRPVERPLVSRHSGVLLPPARNGGSRAHGAPRVPGASRPAPAGEAVAPEAKACIRILVVDDEHLLRESCAQVLRHEGYEVLLCGRGEEALDLVKRRAFDILLVDLYMSQVDGLTLLRAALTTNRDTLGIVMTGNPSVDSSVEALVQGAWDYLPKPFSATHLQVLIGRAVHTLLVARETRDQQAELERRHVHSDKITLLGTAPAFRRAIELARKVAPTDASVFITGESGSGKEMIAQFIHHHSRRSSRPFVAINCAALPEGLLESEMFGHRKGAFTGAVRDKPGLLEAANGGTLFLDELIEMSKPIQAKLLRVIQDGVVRRVGSETTDAIVNVRFVAATNGDAGAAGGHSAAGGVLSLDLLGPPPQQGHPVPQTGGRGAPRAVHPPLAGQRARAAERHRARRRRGGARLRRPGRGLEPRRRGRR